MKTKSIVVVGSMIFSLFPTHCFANAGIPMICLEFPFMILLLVPVILFESVLLSRFLSIDSRESLVLSSKANLLSTFIGFPLAWLLHLFVEILFSLFPYMAYKLNLGMVSENAYKNHELFFDILILLVMAPWLGPIESKLYWMIPAAGVIGLIPAYFVTVLFEYKFLKRKIGHESAIVKRVVIKTNLFSYTLLTLVWVSFFLI